MPAVDVDDLVIRYGGVAAVDRVSFTVSAGEVLALIGPNGAGKTSTIETLEGYRRPAAGRVRVLGLDPVTDHDRLMPCIGVMLQGGGVYPGIRVREVIRLVAALHSDPVDTRSLLDRVGLTHRATATWRTLSGGEQQRLSLALALVARPLVLFLDEPTAGIDPSGRQVIRRIVAEARSSGVAVIVTTHDLEEAEKIADRVVIIDHGRVVAKGTPSELMRCGGTEEIHFAAPPGIDTPALGKALMAAVEEPVAGEYVVRTEATPTNVAALTGWLAENDVPLADLRAGRQSLEDVFLGLTAITGEMPAVRIGEDGPRPTRQ